MHARTRAAALSAAMSIALAGWMAGSAQATDGLNCHDHTYRWDTLAVFGRQPADPHPGAPDRAPCSSSTNPIELVATTPATPTTPDGPMTTPAPVPAAANRHNRGASPRPTGVRQPAQPAAPAERRDGPE